MSDTRTGSEQWICGIVTYDHEARASYQKVSDALIAYTREEDDGRIVDYAADGTVVGIERLY
jgi:uncharacterized protein YuzE